MKISKLLLVSAVAFAMSFNSMSMAKSTSDNSTNFSVAIVNIEQIVESSPQINALKADRKNKIDNLETFIKQANDNLKNETNETKRKTMEESYNKELIKKKDAIDKDFATKLMKIDSEITALIKLKAQKGGYNLTLNKNTVIDGGTDITSEVIKDLK